MKVLKKFTWEMKLTCKGCKSELLAEEGDVKLGVFNVCHYAGDSGDLEFFVDCPVCGDSIVLPEAKLSSNVKKAARAKRGE